MALNYYFYKTNAKNNIFAVLLVNMLFLGFCSFLGY